MSTMSGEPISLSEILQYQVCLDIPVYQRTYEWTAAEWRRLFADVIEQMEPVDPSGKVKPKHFMGTVLTEQEGSGLKRQVRSLVDGQQRFVTLALLSAALRHAREEAQGRDPRSLGDAWFSHVVPGLPTRLRLVPQHSDQQAFVSAIRGDWRSIVAARMKGEPAIWQAYTYFRFLIGLTSDIEDMVLADESPILDRLPLVSIKDFDREKIEKQWLEKLEVLEARKPGSGVPAGPRIPWDLDKLIIAVEERLFFYNLLRGPDDEDTSVIFETINASGRGLFPLDLVKNSIFMRISDPVKRQKIFQEYWNPAEDRLSKTTWPKKRAPYQEVFLYDYLIAAGEHKHQGSLSQSRGYHHFLRCVDRKVPKASKKYDEKLQKFLKEQLFPAAAVWPVAVGAADTVIFEGNSRTVPAKALERITSLMAVSAGPPVPMVMIALVRWLRNDAGWGDATLINALAAVDSYVVRAAVCVSGISNLRSQFMAICGTIDGLSGMLSLTDYKRALRGAETDLAVKAAIAQQPLYLKMKSDALLAVFRGLEAELTPAGAPHPVNASLHSIEHVYPQDPSRWTPDYARWGMDAKAQQQLQDSLHLLGNLTPVTRTHNSSLRNKPYADKKVAIRSEAAQLKVHGGVTRSQKWTAVQIESRGRALASAFIKRWPRP